MARQQTLLPVVRGWQAWQLRKVEAAATMRPTAWATMPRQQQGRELNQLVMGHVEDNLDRGADGPPILHMGNDPVFFDPIRPVGA